MPNWCRNDIEISGKASDIAKLLAEGKVEGQDEEFSVAAFVPMPKEAQEGDWNSWANANWGTKWDLSDVDVDNQGEFAQLHFQTAWSPPVEAFDKISKKFPELEFKMTYIEEGNDFIGAATFKNGLVSQRDASYSEQTESKIVFNFQETTVKKGYIEIPMSVTAKTDPYDLDSETETVELMVKFPEDLEADDIDQLLFDEINFGEAGEFEKGYDRYEDDDMNNYAGEREDAIKEALEENLDEIKKCAHANKLDKALPSKKSKSSKYKL